jgi:DNA invertase Pin-like site-specific DNA recombinase
MSKKVVYGYAHSLDDAAELQGAGATKLMLESLSSIKRPELVRMLALLRPGDIVLVRRLDRLGRSIENLIAVLNAIQMRQATFKSLQEGWADTTSHQGNLALLPILIGLSAFVKERIKTRTSEGRRQAIAKGIKMGRKEKLSYYQKREIKQRIEQGESYSVIARTYGVSSATICRLSKKLLPSELLV